MAEAIALIPDLLFGSQVLSSLRAADIGVALVQDPAAVADALADDAVLIVDLTGDLDGGELLAPLRARGVLDRVKTLGFYSHVDVEAKRRAQAAGFDLIVPRSRMAREGADLVRGLAKMSVGGEGKARSA